MTQWDKLLHKVLMLSSDIRFHDLERVLESYGYVMKIPKGGSSHCVFRKTGCSPITIPRHRIIKKVYIEMVRDIVLREELKDENT